jgi:hypothetical protein
MGKDSFDRGGIGRCTEARRDVIEQSGRRASNESTRVGDKPGEWWSEERMREPLTHGPTGGCWTPATRDVPHDQSTTFSDLPSEYLTGAR